MTDLGQLGSTLMSGALILSLYYLVLRRLALRRTAARTGSPVSGVAEPSPEEPLEASPSPAPELPASLPLRQLPLLWWRRFFRSRGALSREVLLDILEADAFEVFLPMPREVLWTDLRFAATGPLPIRSITFQDGEQAIEPRWCGRWKRSRRATRLRIGFGPDTRLTRITVRLRPGTGAPESVETRIVDRREPDALRLLAAAAAQRRNDATELREQLSQYDLLTRRNRAVVATLAHLDQLAGRDAHAEIHALRTTALAPGGFGPGLYEELRRRAPWHHEAEAIAALVREAGSWDIAGHHGLVTLDAERSFLIGHNGIERERYHETLLVRRGAAARLLRQLNVPMVAGPGGLLFTAARVLRGDGRTVALERDRFTIGSADDDNPFIAVARRQQGTWILPDLERGDVVEFTYDLLRLHPDGKDEFQPFMLANLADPASPSLRCRVSYTAPRDWPLDFAVRGSTAQGKSRSFADGSYTTTEFRQKRTEPRRSHSDPYQRFSLNPFVAGTRRGGGWPEVADRLLGEARATVLATEAIPGPLSAALGDASHPRRVLVRAFSWVRDRIKYGSVASAQAALRDPSRAERIVAAGTGDCKDVSFLLAVVCQQRGIPWEFVLLSSHNGLVVEELPADQFDHMIVRAQVDGDWLYLDASSSYAVFGLLPYAAQGLTALAGPPTRALFVLPEMESAANRLQIRGILDGIEEGWLTASVDLTLTGAGARMLEESWKHRSLIGPASGRAADVVVNGVIPGFRATHFERHESTVDGNVLRATFRGRLGRVVRLGAERLCSFELQVPVLPASPNPGGTFEERFVFAYRAEVELRLEAADAARAEILDLSSASPLDCGFCRITEERVHGDGRFGFVRRIHLFRRVVDGDSLADLPLMFERYEEARRVIVRFSAPEE